MIDSEDNCIYKDSERIESHSSWIHWFSSIPYDFIVFRIFWLLWAVHDDHVFNNVCFQFENHQQFLSFYKTQACVITGKRYSLDIHHIHWRHIVIRILINSQPMRLSQHVIEGGLFFFLIVIYRISKKDKLKHSLTRVILTGYKKNQQCLTISRILKYVFVFLYNKYSSFIRAHRVQKVSDPGPNPDLTRSTNLL